MSVNRREVARYILLPAIIPRVRDQLRAPFLFLPPLLAGTMAMARLLPATHPYLRPENEGTFGIIDVLRTAYGHLVFEWKHIDQILIYFAVLAAYVTFVLTMVVAIAYAVLTPAYAMPTSVSGLMANIYSYTDTPNPGRDVALMLLDRTLGVTGPTVSGSFFGSDVPTMCAGGDLAAGAGACVAPPFPAPFHIAIHNLLAFYSWVVFCFAVLFFLYILATVVMETSIKGQPFGARMNTFWAPLRIVFGLGLLVPLAPHSLNSAQYIVLYTAKVGSAFATNSWLYYNQFLDTHMGATWKNPVGAIPKFTWDPEWGGTVVVIADNSPLAAKLNAPDMGDLIRYLHLVAACEYYYEVIDDVNVRGYFTSDNAVSIKAYSEPSDGGGPSHLNYASALGFYKNGNISLKFGVYDALKYPETNGLNPLCGELVFPATSVDDTTSGTIGNPGAAAAQEWYYEYFHAIWDKTSYTRQLMDGYARQMVGAYAKTGAGDGCRFDTDNDGIQNDPLTGINLPELGFCWDDPPATYIQGQVERIQTIYNALVKAANIELSKPENFAIDSTVLNSGWAGAGIWYQKIAAMNGTYVSAIQQIPYGAKLPTALEEAKTVSMMVRKKMVNPKNMLDVPPEAGRAMLPENQELAVALNRVNAHLNNDNAAYSFFPDSIGPPGIGGVVNGYPINNVLDKQPNVIMSTVNSVLGTDFLFSFKDNRDIHPLAQLVTFGRTILERSARNLLTGSAIASAGGLISLGNQDIAGGLRGISSFYMVVASIFFTAGFMLFYILPLLPFIYFFFAVLSWVKAILEALIGAPLWAMAHIRLPGNGFPSGPSQAGYLLLMEIFLRPVVTVFALVVAIGVYGGVVYFLNDTLEFVLFVMGRKNLADLVGDQQSLGGIRGLIDVFFFTIMYIMLVYMLANSCFKMIDTIPNRFMRWFGRQAGSFAAASFARDNPAGTFTQNAYVALGDPVMGMINKIDNAAFDTTAQAANLYDANNGGQIRKTIQDAFGKDRTTRIDDMLMAGLGSEMKTSIREAKKADDFEATAKKAEEKAMRAEDPQEKANLQAEASEAKKQAAEARIQSQINDPELLIKEMLNPGNSGMSLEAVARARAENKFASLEEKLKDPREVGWDLMQSHNEAAYVDKQQVWGNMVSRIRSLKERLSKGEGKS